MLGLRPGPYQLDRSALDNAFTSGQCPQMPLSASEHRTLNSLAKQLARARDHGSRSNRTQEQRTCFLCACGNLTSPTPGSPCGGRTPNGTVASVFTSTSHTLVLYSPLDIFERLPTSLSRHSTSWTAKSYLQYGADQVIATSIPAARSAEPHARRTHDVLPLPIDR